MQLIREFPNILALKKQGYVCADLHFHSTFSDGRSTPQEIVQKAKELGIGFAITDHNEIRGSLEASTEDVLIIPSIEVTSIDKKDLLIYFYKFEDLKDFYDKYVKNNKFPNRGLNLNKLLLKFSEIIKHAREYKCVLVLPHPYTIKPKDSWRFIESSNELIEEIDCVEILNGLLNKRRNQKAMVWGEKHNKSPFGGSDGHHLGALGNVVTAIKCKPNISSFLDNLKEGNSIVVGEELSLRKAFSSRTAIIKNNVIFRRKAIMGQR